MFIHVYDLSVSFIVLDSILVLERIMQFTSLGILDKQFYIMHYVSHMYVCCFDFHIMSKAIFLNVCKDLLLMSLISRQTIVLP